ncbi:MAG: hypothetical protein D6732_18140 [Methanobacteriota archaeon]|nr:MAG: hypothetical protein D6732_18140 [Euryarchaeota archaeon]
MANKKRDGDIANESIRKLGRNATKDDVIREFNKLVDRVSHVGSMKSLLSAIVMAVDTSTALRHVRRFFIISAIINIVAMGAVVMAFMYKPEPRYFLSDAGGHLIPIKPLSERVLSQTAVKRWVINVLMRTFTLDSTNWKMQINWASKYFEPKAYSDLLKELTKPNGLMEELSKYSGAMNLIVDESILGDRPYPIQVFEGISHTPPYTGRHYYAVRVPVRLSIKTLKGVINEKYVIEVIVVRTPPSEGKEDGVAVARLKFIPAEIAAGDVQ